MTFRFLNSLVSVSLILPLATLFSCSSVGTRYAEKIRKYQSENGANEAYLRRYCEENPKVWGASLAFGNWLEARSRPEEAARVLDAALAQGENAPLLVARARVETDFVRKEALARKALSLDADSPAALEQLGSGQFGQGKTQEAVRTFVRLTEIDPWNMNGWWWLATVHLFSGRRDEAAKALERDVWLNLASSAEIPWARWKTLSLIYRDNPDWPEAERNFLVRMSAPPGADPESFYRGFPLPKRHAGKPIDPEKFESVQTQLKSALALYRGGKYAEAEKAYRAILDVAPVREAAIYRCLSVYLSRDHARAERLALEWLDQSPRDLDGMEIVALVRRDAGNRKGFEKALESAQTVHPGNGFLASLRGICLLDYSDANQAKRYFEHSLALGGGGWALRELGRRLDAVELAQKKAQDAAFLKSLQTAFLMNSLLSRVPTGASGYDPNAPQYQSWYYGAQTPLQSYNQQTMANMMWTH